MLIIFGFVAPSISPSAASAATGDASTLKDGRHEIVSAELFLMRQQAELRDLKSKLDATEQIDAYGSNALYILTGVSLLAMLQSLISQKNIAAIVRTMSTEEVAAYRANPSSNPLLFHTRKAFVYSTFVKKYSGKAITPGAALLFANGTALRMFKVAIEEKNAEIDWTLRRIRLLKASDSTPSSEESTIAQSSGANASDISDRSNPTDWTDRSRN
jgi:hypothetical protein